jgi:hypothetical protein
MWDRLLAIMEANQDRTRSGLVRRRDDRDWVGAALNAPAGRLTELALLRSQPSNAGAKIDSVWLERLARLLALPGDASGHALVFLARHLDYLHARAPEWTKDHIMPFRHGDDDRRSIFWIARFWNNHGLSVALFAELRDDLLGLVSARCAGREWNMPLAGQILLGWHGLAQREAGIAFSDAELRSALLAGNDEFRRQVLHTLRGWIAEPEWLDAAHHLVADIWPRQLPVRSAGVIAALVNLVLASGEHFPRFVAEATDLLEPLARESHWQLSPDQSKQLAATQPETMLVLLDKILSVDPGQWPHGIDSVLSVIADGGGQADPRLVGLQKLLADWR